MELNIYQNLFSDIKQRILSSQLKAALSVNAEMIFLYWQIGNSIAQKQTEQGWSSGVIPQLAKDLKIEFPNSIGYSERNLSYMLKFAKEYQDITILQQTVAKLPWGHNILLIEKIKDQKTRFWYVEKCIENNWSRDILDLQIKSKLIERQGKSVNNFENTLPKPLSDLANQTLKDPYIFDFLALDADFREKDIEKQLTHHITKFLLELGKGFSFLGNQYHLEIGNQDYYLDLLFYHIKLKCYIVIELKNTKFKPEYTGKLNFYLSAVDSLIKEESENPTIGILLCKDKNNIEAEFALRDINKPIGISEIQLVEKLPDNLKSALPTIEEIENELKNFGNK
ncbi:PDDEXK nuclease domain-containing protein [Epilithonimonas caeni]|uniref:PDDEXK nuclease domain-containing protein n=1 Tax=Epilithonimonas caeni TaxID=365343 RepID=UPI0004050362|nr:PDDEXK nuclease domain-containing protein [Epilithonimonas caeni]